MTSSLGQQTQFKYFYNALVNKFPGLGTNDATDVFQFSTVPYAAGWADSSAESIYASANITSTSVGPYLVPGHGFDTSYATLIRSLKVPNSTNNRDYQQAQTQLNDVAAQYKGELDKANAAYSDWKATNTAKNGTTPPFEKWLLSINGQEYQAVLHQLSTQMTALTNTLADITKTLDAAESAAQAALTTDQMTITPSAGDTIKVPRFSISGNLANDKAKWDEYQADQWDLEVTIDSSATITHKWKVLYEQSVDQQCFTTSAEGAINVSRIIQDREYSLTLKAKGVELYNIVRGEWYDPVYVNPHVPLEANVPGVTDESMFGVNGPLHLIPEGLVVIYKPTMSLTTTTETYEQYISGHAGVDVDWLDIFGLRFNFGESSGIKVAQGPTTTTVEMPIPGASAPQVFGVQSKVAFLPPS